MSASQIIFFEKNKADYSLDDVTTTASQGDAYADYALNRSNQSAWVTSGSVDADNTTFEVDWADQKRITDILLVLHNFKAYTIQYWDGSLYQDFSPAISETTNTVDTTHHSFTEVITNKIKLTITGTMVANEDKVLRQLIATKQLGQFAAWPIIDNPTISRNRQRTKMLSGKESIRENVGLFTCKLKIAYLKSDADCLIVESLFEANEGFLVWLCGGDESQFATNRKGYRLEDIYLMKCSNEYSPEWYQGLYKTGMVVDMQLVEVVD